MEEDNAFQTTDTTGQEKKNSEPQEDWKDYAYGGKSLLDNSDDSRDVNEASANIDAGETTVADQPQEDWKDYAYGGKSLLDDSSVAQESADIRPESSKPTDLEQKRNLVIGYVPPVENTEMEQRLESQNSEQNIDAGETTVADQPQEDWKDYAYGGKSLLDNSDDSRDVNEASANIDAGETTVADQPQEDWKDYAYGGKSLLDNSSIAQESADIRPESSKPTDLEQKRNLVIEYVPLVENTEMEQRPESQDSEQK